jgi:hypothetical protein
MPDISVGFVPFHVVLDEPNENSVIRFGPEHSDLQWNRLVM